MRGAEEISKLVVERALELGFDRVGIAPIAPPTRGDVLRQWLDEGLNGEMDYLARNVDMRLDPTLLHPGARSAVAVAVSHAPTGPQRAGGVAAYARGRDYHKILRKRLRKLGSCIDRELGAGSCLSRPFVDSAPVLERDLAERVGIGWIGKNTNVISQGLGSFLFLGELFVGHELVPSGGPRPARCGRCTECLDLCPTGAILEPYKLHAPRCISYLTIEHKGAIPRHLRRGVGDRLFGCDICQLVCPWNRETQPSRDIAFQSRPEIVGVPVVAFLAMPQPDFDAIFVASPIRRTGLERMARNAAVVLGNSGDADNVPHLIGALQGNPSGLVRAHAAWALGELATAAARDALERARHADPEGEVRREVELALQPAG